MNQEFHAFHTNDKIYSSETILSPFPNMEGTETILFYGQRRQNVKVAELSLKLLPTAERHSC